MKKLLVVLPVLAVFIAAHPVVTVRDDATTPPACRPSCRS